MASSRKKTKTMTKTSAKSKMKTKTTAQKPPTRATATAKASAKGLALTAAGPSFTVDNLQKSIAWYRDVLGFTEGERWQEKGTLLGIELKAGSVTFMISQDDWSKGRHRIKGAGFRIACETSQDIDALVEGIKSRGGSLSEEPRNEMGMRAFSVQDPDGFKITIWKNL